MQKNVVNQKWVVFAFNETDNIPLAGDAANITANIRLEGGAANAVDDTNPTELEDGYYVFDISQAECNADLLSLHPESTTPNIQVIGVPGAIYTSPASFNDEALALASVATEARLGELDAANLPTDISTNLTAILTRLASSIYSTDICATGVTVTDGTIISGGYLETCTVTQEYLKVQETGMFKIDFDFTGLTATEDKLNVIYRYFGPGSSNHNVECLMWNYTLAQWDDMLATVKDFPNTDEDTRVEIDISGTVSDYFTGTSPNIAAQVRIEHTSNNDPDHQFWVEYLTLGEVEQIYVPADNVGITAIRAVVEDGVYGNSALKDLLDILQTESASHPTLTEIESSTILAKEASVINSYRDIISVIESQRGHHTHSGNIFYWDAINGNDSNDGLTPATAKLTYDFADVTGGIHGLLTDSNHDLIIILPGASAGYTEINEYIEIDTRYTFLRAMGRDIFVNATHSETYAVLASAEGVEISGIRVNTRATGSQKAVGITGDFAWIHNIWVDFSRGSGVELNNVSNCLIEDLVVQDAATGGSGHGIHIKGDVSLTSRNFIKNIKSLENGDGGATDGIRIDGIFCDHNFIIGGERGIISHNNTGWGINEVNDADHTIIIGPSIHLGHNTLGKYNLIGDDSIIENEGQWATETMLTDVRDEALGKWVVDPDNDTLTLYRIDGVTVLKVFDLTSTTELVPQYIDRDPQ